MRRLGREGMGILYRKKGEGNLVVFLLAERAPSEGPRSTRAFEERPGRPH